MQFRQTDLDLLAEACERASTYFVLRDGEPAASAQSLLARGFREGWIAKSTDAGYDSAIATARERGVDLPMITDRGPDPPVSSDGGG